MNEKVTMIAEQINAALGNGYFPEEDVLNGPRTRVIPAKLRYVIMAGAKAIHMNTDNWGQSTYDIAI